MSAAFLPLLGKGRDVTPGYTPFIVNMASISGSAGTWVPFQPFFLCG
jgi:hypothetical protein